MDLDLNTLTSKAENMAIANQALIDGNKVDAQSGKTFDCISPIDGHVLAQVASCDSADVDQAVKAARKTFESGVWAKQSPQDRKKTLLKLADLIDEHHVELALLETLDMGKPINDSLTSDIPGAANKVRWIAECIDKLYGDVAPTADNIYATITREPVGVVAAVVPWNFPLFLACAKIAPALAMGNSVILKPAEQSPLTAIRLGELALEAGIPPGVVNVVTGFGETAGQALGMHPDVDVVAFVGSTETGKLFLNYSAQSNMKRVFLECGGKSPNLIFADCYDLETAVRESAYGVFHNQGQICCAPTRLLVEASIEDAVKEQLDKVQREFQPGNPLDPNTRVGALVDNTQMQRVLNYIRIGEKEGANLCFGGKQTREETQGFYIEPTVFSKVNNQMQIAREEIFGPVIVVIPFKTEEEAIQIANDTSYGLAASLWTGNLNRTIQVSKAIRAGVVSVNCIDSGDSTTTFGGYKQSGIGRDGGLQQFANYSELKTTWIKLD